MKLGDEQASGFLKDKKYLIMDRDPLHTTKYRQLLKTSGVKAKFVPKRASFLNCYAEHFVWRIREECLNKMIFIGESSVHKAVNAIRKAL